MEFIYEVLKAKEMEMRSVPDNDITLEDAYIYLTNSLNITAGKLPTLNYVCFC